MLGSHPMASPKMPDGSFLPNTAPQLIPYRYFGPKPYRNDLIVDHQGVFLADPDGNFLGYAPVPPPPVGRLATVQRSSVRNE
jgi:hypothetical protein